MKHDEMQVLEEALRDANIEEGEVTLKELMDNEAVSEMAEQTVFDIEKGLVELKFLKDIKASLVRSQKERKCNQLKSVDHGDIKTISRIMKDIDEVKTKISLLDWNIFILKKAIGLNVKEPFPEQRVAVIENKIAGNKRLMRYVTQIGQAVDKLEVKKD